MITKEKINIFNCWNNHSPLEGMLVTLEELREHVPEHTKEGIVVKIGTFGKDKSLPGFNIYGRPNSQRRDAWGCPHCDQIRIGYPFSAEYERRTGPHSKVKIAQVICQNKMCGDLLYEAIAKRYD